MNYTLTNTIKGTSGVNRLDYWLVVDESNKIIAKFRTKMSGMEFIKKKGFLFKLKLVKNENFK
jgi:hypothetical protein